MTLVSRLGLLQPRLIYLRRMHPCLISRYLYHGYVLTLTVIPAFRRFITQGIIASNFLTTTAAAVEEDFRKAGAGAGLCARSCANTRRACLGSTEDDA